MFSSLQGRETEVFRALDASYSKLTTHPQQASPLRNVSDDILHQPVEHQTLLARDVAALRVILPRADLQQTTGGTGIEGFAGRLVQRRKAILSDCYHAIAAVHSLTHHRFLAGGDGGTHQDAASLAAGQPLLTAFGILLVIIRAMDDDGDLLRNVKQEAVTHQLTVPLADVSMVQGGEKSRTQPLDGQAPGVVVEVVLPVGELPVVKENQVIIASLEERGEARSRAGTARS